MEKELTIGLFDPGMTHLHKTGLAGLYMSLAYFEKNNVKIKNGSWDISDPIKVTLKWKGSDKEFFDDLFKKSFGISRDGLIDFAAHRGTTIGDKEKVALSEAVRFTFLQHNKFNNIPKGTTDNIVSFQYDKKTAIYKYKPFVKPYAHSLAAKDFSGDSVMGEENIEIKGWAFPGAVKRHEKCAGSEIEETVGRFICLLYAPMATMYFRLSHKGSDGKYDKKRGYALVLPHIENIKEFSKKFSRYLLSPIERLCADGLGDAGLMALLELKAGDPITKLGISGCHAFTMGSVTWSSQQKTRTGAFSLDSFSDATINQFETALKTLPNKLVFTKTDETVKKKKTQKSASETNFFITTSLCRGLFSENIAMGKDWYHGFTTLMKSKKLVKYVLYENIKGGLADMVKEIQWDGEMDRKFVEAVHVAVKNRYGALASQAKSRGENVRFDREFEKMRSGLMRAKNQQTLRAEIADLFARGGINKSLQENWSELLPLFTGKDWQKAKDLALLALASYKGKETKSMGDDMGNMNKEEE